MEERDYDIRRLSYQGEDAAAIEAAHKKEKAKKEKKVNKLVKKAM